MRLRRYIEHFVKNNTRVCEFWLEIMTPSGRSRNPTFIQLAFPRSIYTGNFWARNNTKARNVHFASCLTRRPGSASSESFCSVLFLLLNLSPLLAATKILVVEVLSPTTHDTRWMPEQLFIRNRRKYK